MHYHTLCQVAKFSMNNPTETKAINLNFSSYSPRTYIYIYTLFCFLSVAFSSRHFFKLHCQLYIWSHPSSNSGSDVYISLAQELFILQVLWVIIPCTHFPLLLCSLVIFLFTHYVSLHSWYISIASLFVMNDFFLLRDIIKYTCVKSLLLHLNQYITFFTNLLIGLLAFIISVL